MEFKLIFCEYFFFLRFFWLTILVFIHIDTCTVWAHFYPAACGAAAAAAGCSAAPLQFLLLLLCTAAANVAAPAAGDSQLLPSLAAGYQFSCSAARGCHDRASAPAAATLAAAAGFWAGQ